MGLAPYGRPVYADAILQAPDRSQARRQLLAEHGLLQLLPGPDDDRTGGSTRLFGGPPRQPESTLEQRHMDLAASIQAVTEEVVLRMGRDLHRGPGMKNLVLAGGVALNCVANGRLLREGPFEDIWIQPAAGDAGGALGAALFVWHQLLDKPRQPDGHDAQQGSLLGPRVLRRRDRARSSTSDGAATDRFDDEDELLDHVAGAAGRGEGRRLVPRPDGVRPAGARGAQHPRRPALAADAGDDEPEDQVPRELPPVRPVRAARARPRVVRHAAGRGEPVHAAGRPGAGRAPRAARRTRTRGRWRDDPDLRAARQRRPQRRSRPSRTSTTAPACRPSTSGTAAFHRLLQAFHEQTGCPVLVNTSFNVRGEPIV